MFIVMHCIGMPFDGDTVRNKSLGGSESAAYYMARELARAGHIVTMFTNTDHEGMYEGVKYIPCGQPNEQSPFGAYFHAYAENTPHDVLIIQRDPRAFRFPWACKVGLWWIHDIALGRSTDEVKTMVWNCDAILTVTEWHRNQAIESWGVNPDFVRAIQNGVDLTLFGGVYPNADPQDLNHPRAKLDANKFKLLYAARPERGLITLVKEDGIMERLAKELPTAHLYTCTYDNVAPQLAPLYNYLDSRIAALPNVTKLGHLTKQQLADVMRSCDLYMYPTTFEDTSCIAMMECAAAGLPVITSDIAALPETTKDGGVVRFALKDGEVNIDDFVREVGTLSRSPEMIAELRQLQANIAPRFDWKNAASMLLKHVENIFELKRNDGAALRGLIHNSDIYAAQYYLRAPGLEFNPDPISERCQIELQECYGFAWNNKFKEHYEAYYEYEKNRGVEYGPEILDGNVRFEHVCKLVSISTINDDVVVDYGCAHGHYTINLAKRFPDVQFVGLDIAESNIEKARAWAEKDGVKNVKFYAAAIGSKGFEFFEGSEEARTTLNKSAKVLIAAEVLEHVSSPADLASQLCKFLLQEDGTAIFTTPIGPWEATGYREHHPWRAHLHHLERADLHDLWGHNAGFAVAVAPAGANSQHETLGSYITTFRYNSQIEVSKIVDYSRKFRLLSNRQTLSVCYIVRNAEATLLRSLESIKEHADEIVLAIDNTTDDGTREIITKFQAECAAQLWPVVRTIEIESPLKIGFDAARNFSIAQASCEWIFWLDSDEIIVNADRIAKYLRNNNYHGYAIKQHHFTVEPLGVQRTDLPCRLFRNGRGVKFFGVVHEHPEVELNKGVGHVMLAPDIDIAHEGYTTERIRQKRFERNLGLMVRDREVNPERILGKFLWVRDVAQMAMFELNHTRKITSQMQQRAHAAIKLFDDLLKDERTPMNMLAEAVEFYTVLVNLTDPGSMEIGFEFNASKLNGGVHPERRIVTKVASKEHAQLLLERASKEKMKRYESRYY